MNKLLALAAIMIALCSCERIDLATEIPGLQGKWIWDHSYYSQSGEKWDTTNNPVDVVLSFEEGNRISVLFQGFELVANEKYSVTKVDKKTGYVIKLPQNVKKELHKKHESTFSKIQIDGYIGIRKRHQEEDTYLMIMGEEETYIVSYFYPFE